MGTVHSVTASILVDGRRLTVELKGDSLYRDVLEQMMWRDGLRECESVVPLWDYGRIRENGYELRPEFCTILYISDPEESFPLYKLREAVNKWSEGGGREPVDDMLRRLRESDADSLFLNSYRDLYNTVLKARIAEDIRESGLRYRSGAWKFYLSEDTLKQLEKADPKERRTER